MPDALLSTLLGVVACAALDHVPGPVRQLAQHALQVLHELVH